MGRKKSENPYKILTALKEDGGLGLCDLEIKDKALKAQWPVKIQKNKKLENLADILIQNPIGKNFWRCNLKFYDISKVLPIKSPFWRDIVFTWSSVTYEIAMESQNHLKEQILWFNSHIRVENLPIFNSKWYQKGIIKIEDILNQDGKFMEFREFQGKYGINAFLQYYGLLSAIPAEWKSEVNLRDASNGYNYKVDQWGECSKVASIMYRILNKNENMVKPVLKKWNMVLGVECTLVEFLGIIQRLYYLTISTKLRSFQYRFLFHAVITNKHLKHYGIKEHDLCSFCELYPESIKHLFYDCSEVQELWKHL